MPASPLYLPIPTSALFYIAFSFSSLACMVSAFTRFLVSPFPAHTVPACLGIYTSLLFTYYTFVAAVGLPPPFSLLHSARCRSVHAACRLPACPAAFFHCLQFPSPCVWCLLLPCPAPVSLYSTPARWKNFARCSAWSTSLPCAYLPTWVHSFHPFPHPTLPAHACLPPLSLFCLGGLPALFLMEGEASHHRWRKEEEKSEFCCQEEGKIPCLY